MERDAAPASLTRHEKRSLSQRGLVGGCRGKEKRKSPGDSGESETRCSAKFFRKTTGEEQRRRGHNAASLKNNSFNHNVLRRCAKKRSGVAREPAPTSPTPPPIVDTDDDSARPRCVDGLSSLFVVAASENHPLPSISSTVPLLTITRRR